MTDTTGALPPAGWYPDPYGAPFERWWDGTGWTTHTNTPEPAAPAAPAAPATPEPAPYAAPVQADPFANFASPNQQDPTQPEPFGQPATAEPAFEQPAYQPPSFEQPAYQPPVSAQPAFEQPAYQPPATGQPAYQPPAAEQPAYQPPATGQPAYQPPATGQPTYQPPAAEQPTFEPPQFGAPAYAAPQTAEPAYQPPAESPYPENLYRPPGEQPEAAPVRERYDDQPFAQPVQYQAPAASPQPAQGGMPNPPSSFDFGFGPAGSESSGMPSNASIPAQGESGFFGSWEPNEYTEPPSNRAANAGLVFGVLSFFLSAVFGLIGLIVSVVGLARAGALAREGAGPVGRGKAVAGIILSLVGSVASTAAILYGLQFFAINLFNSATQDPGTDQVVDDGVNLTANGGIPLEIGATGVIPLPDSETPAISFVVTSVTPGFTCTAPEEEVVSAENGQFIAVAMDVTLDANYLAVMDSGVALRMDQSDWIGYSADPTAGQVDNTDGGISCIPATEQFPDELVAGATTSAVIVLDMGVDTASISWAPTGVIDLDPGVTRWEWTVA